MNKQARFEHLYDQLRTLVYDDRRRNELAARAYLLGCLCCLNDRADILCHGYVESIVDFKPEDPGRYGPCDLVVVADIVESTEERRRRAYVWEIKAPQSHLFEHETKNRVHPSSDLAKAENQLFITMKTNVEANHFATSLVSCHLRMLFWAALLSVETIPY